MVRFHCEMRNDYNYVVVSATIVSLLKVRVTRVTRLSMQWSAVSGHRLCQDRRVGLFVYCLYGSGQTFDDVMRKVEYRVQDGKELDNQKLVTVPTSKKLQIFSDELIFSIPKSAVSHLYITCRIFIAHNG